VGWVTLPNGSVTGENESATVPNGSVTGENESATVPNSSVTGENESATVPNGSVTGENESATVPNGSVTGENESATVPNGSVTASNGSATAPNGSAPERANVMGGTFLLNQVGVSPTRSSTFGKSRTSSKTASGAKKREVHQSYVLFAQPSEQLLGILKSA